MGPGWQLEATTLVGETRVLFDNIAAIVIYSVRGQVGTIIPDEVAGKKTTEMVVEYQGKRSPAVTLAVVDSAPALFTLNASGKGQAGMLNETGCCNTSAKSVGNRQSSLGVTMAVRSARQRILVMDDDVANRDRLARILY